MERSSLAHLGPLWFGVAVLIALRLVHLGADTPPRVGTGSVGVFVDEGYKTLEARNLVEWGARRWTSADGYSGWADTSPLGHGGFLLAFRALGPGLEAARLVTIAWTAMLLIAWVAASSSLPTPIAWLGLGLLGLQHTTFFFSRIALFELPLIVCLYGSLLPMLDREAMSRRAAVWIATCALIAGLGLKPSALLYFVPVAGGLVVASWQRGQLQGRVYVAFTAAILLVPLAWGFLHRGALEGRLAVPRLGKLRLVLLNPLSFASGVLLATALLGLAWILCRDPRGFLASPYRAALTLTAVTGPLLFAPFPYAPLRYHVPLLPAFALLALEVWRFRSNEPRAPSSGSTWWADAVSLVVTIWSLLYLGHTVDQQLLRHLPIPWLDLELRGRSPIRLVFLLAPSVLVLGYATWRCIRRLDRRRARPMLAALIAVALMVDLWSIGRFLLHPTYRIREITHAIDAALDGHHPEARASLAGDWAPLFTLDTGRPALYLAEPDNAPERLGELRPDAFLFSDTLAGHAARDLLTAGIDGLSLGPALYTGEYVGRELVLYAVSETAAGRATGEEVTGDSAVVGTEIEGEP